MFIKMGAVSGFKNLKTIGKVFVACLLIFFVAYILLLFLALGKHASLSDYPENLRYVIPFCFMGFTALIMYIIGYLNWSVPRIQNPLLSEYKAPLHVLCVGIYLTLSGMVIVGVGMYYHNGNDSLNEDLIGCYAIAGGFILLAIVLYLIERSANVSYLAAGLSLFLGLVTLGVAIGYHVTNPKEESEIKTLYAMGTTMILTGLVVMSISFWAKHNYVSGAFSEATARLISQLNMRKEETDKPSAKQIKIKQAALDASENLNGISQDQFDADEELIEEYNKIFNELEEETNSLKLPSVPKNTPKNKKTEDEKDENLRKRYAALNSPESNYKRLQERFNALKEGNKIKISS